MKHYIIIFLFLISCKKEHNQTHEITYTFQGTPPYFIEIYDSTNKNDFSDSVYTATYVKTVVYDYAGTFNCGISCNKINYKKITISTSSNTTTRSDTLYPSLNSFITL